MRRAERLRSVARAAVERLTKPNPTDPTADTNPESLPHTSQSSHSSASSLPSIASLILHMTIRSISHSFSSLHTDINPNPLPVSPSRSTTGVPPKRFPTRGILIASSFLSMYVFDFSSHLFSKKNSEKRSGIEKKNVSKNKSGEGVNQDHENFYCVGIFCGYFHEF